MTTRPSLLRAVPAALVRYLNTLRLGAGFRLLRCSAAIVLFCQSRVASTLPSKQEQSKSKTSQGEAG